ncbi:CD225/dispanin family protein [Sunxiuqinia elliptica]|uniref:Interferon-induced transmembrane protein n=1 Tax=Sunxiuqinia elliptica TaxID=655355 RepID=A0A4R6HBA7_9BACT|nr:CD225/dispanin family protein [Sunxiuqinia elliptica]TDO05680.1 interferon-induced transmembrane protein [Sunxiuqinia elliptica]TDO65222.1 interferon-induced transmembrane protein [Sunxiuqinia elliptica]
MENQPMNQRPPKTWLVESILVTLFCCLPFGIAGIVNAAKVESRFYAKDIEGAQRASSEAGKWTKIGFFIGIAGIAIYFILMILGVAAGFLAS